MESFTFISCPDIGSLLSAAGRDASLGLQGLSTLCARRLKPWDPTA